MGLMHCNCRKYRVPEVYSDMFLHLDFRYLGNIVPEMYGKLYSAALNGDWAECEKWQEATDKVAVIYQKDRTLGESLAALKVLMNAVGICNTTMMPPLTELTESQLAVAENNFAELMRKLG